MKKPQVLTPKNFHENVKKLTFEKFFNMFQGVYQKDALENVAQEMGLEGAPAAPEAPAADPGAEDLTGEDKDKKGKKK